MDLFTTKRFSLWTIVVLIILNIITLSIIWIGQTSSYEDMPGPRPRQDRKSLELLKNELNLTDQQFDKYLLLRREHHERTQTLVREIPRLKKEMMDEIFKANPDTSKVQEYSKLIGEKQTEIERITFNHLLDLKDLCGKDQEENLHGLLQEFFRRSQPMERQRRPRPRDRNKPLPPPARE